MTEQHVHEWTYDDGGMYPQRAGWYCRDWIECRGFSDTLPEQLRPHREENRSLAVLLLTLKRRYMRDNSPCWCVSQDEPHARWVHSPQCLAARAFVEAWR